MKVRKKLLLVSSILELDTIIPLLAYLVVRFVNFSSVIGVFNASIFIESMFVFLTVATLTLDAIMAIKLYKAQDEKLLSFRVWNIVFGIVLIFLGCLIYIYMIVSASNALTKLLSNIPINLLIVAGIFKLISARKNKPVVQNNEVVLDNVVVLEETKEKDVLVVNKEAEVKEQAASTKENLDVVKIMEKLEKLSQLKSSGVITEEEYDKLHNIVLKDIKSKM